MSASSAEQTQNAPAMPPRGELARWPLLYLYYRAASTGQSGRLTLVLSDRSLTIDFHRGAPDAVASNHPQDALGPFLVRSGAVSQDALTQLQQSPAHAGQELTTALLSARLLDPQALWTQLMQQAQTLLLAGVISHTGSFHFDPEAPRVPQAFPMGDRWGLITALVRRIPNATLRHRLEPVWSRPVMRSGGTVEVAELRLTPQETRALSRFDGVSTLAQLTAAHPPEADAFMRLAFLLRHLEAVSFLAPGGGDVPAGTGATAPPPPADINGATRTSEASTRTPGGTRAVAAPSAHTPGGTRAVAAPSAHTPGGTRAVAARPTAQTPPPPASGGPRRDTHPPGAASVGGPVPQRAGSNPGRPAVQRPVTRTPAHANTPVETLVSLQALVQSLRSQNHFERLGIREDAPESAAKIAYFKLARQHHPDTVPVDAPEGFAKLKADIFAYVGEAYRTLSDPQAREVYLEELAGGGEVDVRAILQAEELFRQASLLIKRRKFAEALPLLNEAILLNPDEGEFYAWRGWAYFCLQTDRRTVSPEARSDLDAANRMNPNCAAIHHFEGSIARVRGLDDEARRHLERCIQLHPDHVEAARELRFLSTKR